MRVHPHAEHVGGLQCRMDQNKTTARGALDQACEERTILASLLGSPHMQTSASPPSGVSLTLNSAGSLLSSMLALCGQAVSIPISPHSATP